MGRGRSHLEFGRAFGDSSAIPTYIGEAGGPAVKVVSVGGAETNVRQDTTGSGGKRRREAVR